MKKCHKDLLNIQRDKAKKLREECDRARSKLEEVKKLKDND